MTRANTTSPERLESDPAVTSFSRYFPTVRLFWGCLVSASAWSWRGRRTIGHAMVVAVLAVVSTYGWWEYSVGTQRDAVAAITRAGGNVYYDWEWRNSRPLPRGARPPGPDWVVKTLGPDFVGHIVAVDVCNRGNHADDGLMTYVGRLGRLEYLSLGNAAVTDRGLARLRDLTCLKGLYIFDTPFSASSLAHLERMVELEYLILPDIPLSDTDLAHLAGLTKLKNLTLSGKRITNTGLARLGSMRDMEVLTLRQTSITTLEPIRALTRLVQLDISGSPIDDAGMKPASAFRDLDMLRLGQSRVTDAGMAFISGLPNLSVLELERTRVGDTGLGLLCGHPRIMHLGLAGTDVTDAGLAGLADKLNLSPCRDLVVSGPRVTQAGVQSLRAKLTHTQVSGLGVMFPVAHSDAENQQGKGVDDESPQ